MVLVGFQCFKAVTGLKNLIPLFFKGQSKIKSIGFGWVYNQNGSHVTAAPQISG
jgi:hypothetical protein